MPRSGAEATEVAEVEQRSDSRQQVGPAKEGGEPEGEGGRGGKSVGTSRPGRGMPRQRLGKKNNETHNPVTARRIPSTRFSSRPVILRSGSLTLEPKPPAIEPRPGTNEAVAVTVVTIACTSATRAANASDASP